MNPLQFPAVTSAISFWGCIIAVAVLCAAAGAACLFLQKRHPSIPDQTLFKKFFELGLAGNAISDFDKRWVQVNDSLCKMLGYSREELLNMTWTEMTHPEDLQLDVTQFEKMLAGETEGYTIDKRFICKNGRIIRVNLSVSCVRHNKKITHILASVLDITKRYQAENQVRELSQALIKSQEQERQQISRDLHDNFAQELSSLKLGMQTLFHSEQELPDAHKARLLDMMEILQNTIKGIRDLSSELRPQGLIQLGLSRTLESYCERFTTKTGTAVHFSSAGLNKQPLPEEMQINCYRIVQEALSNALRHAGEPGSFQIWVKLAVSYPDFILRIEDDGKGFNHFPPEEQTYSSKTHNMGLRNMQERTSLLGGSLRINSAPGKGSKIVIRIPIGE